VGRSSPVPYHGAGSGLFRSPRIPPELTLYTTDLNLGDTSIIDPSLAPWLTGAGVVLLVLMFALTLRRARPPAGPLRVASTEEQRLIGLAQQLADQLDRKARNLEELIRQAERAARTLEGVRAGGEVEKDPLVVKVIALDAEGVSPLEIARRLDEHIGKIELILALERSHGTMGPRVNA